METTFTQRAELTMGLTDSLRGQIRAIKDANDSSSHIDSRSGMGGTGDGSYSSLASQGEEGSPNDSDDEKYDEKKVSDVLSRTCSRRKS